MDFLKKSLLFFVGLVTFAFMVGVGFTLLATIVVGVIIARIVWHWRIKQMRKKAKEQNEAYPNSSEQSTHSHEKTVIIDAEYEVIDDDKKDNKHKGN